MKYLTTILLSTGCWLYSAQADGVVKLNNYDSQMPVYWYTLAPVGTFVQLLWQVDGSGWEPVNIAGTTTSILQLKEPGYFDAGIGEIPNIDGNVMVNFELRAWLGSSTFESASLVGSSMWSQTTMTWDAATGLPSTGAELAIPSPVICAMPEPQTIALWGVGGGILWAAGRRKTLLK